MGVGRRGWGPVKASGQAEEAGGNEEGAGGAPADSMGKRHNPTDVLQRSQGWCGPQAWPGEELGKGRSDQPE